MTRREVKQLVRSFSVASCVNGKLVITPRYRDESLDPTCTPVGVITRLALANWAEKILNGAIPK
jgi:hypothetical protein